MAFGTKVSDELVVMIRSRARALDISVSFWCFSKRVRFWGKMEEFGERMANILMLNPWATPPMVAGNMRKTIRTKKKTGIILDMFLRLMFEF